VARGSLPWSLTGELLDLTVILDLSLEGDD